MKKFLYVVTASFLLVTLFGLIDAAGFTPKGTLIGILEMAIEVIALFFVLKIGQHKFTKGQFYSLILFLVFIAIGDLFYMYFYYFLKVGRPTPSITLLTSLPYAICCYSMAIFYTLAIKKNLKAHVVHLIFILPFSILTPIAARLALPLFSDNSQGSVYFYLELLGLFGSYFLFISSFVVFLAARETFWSLLSSATLIMMLASWAIKADKFLGLTISFLNYEYLWALGAVMTSLVLCSIRPVSNQVSPYDRMSIALNGRLAAIILTFTTVILIVATQKEVELVRFVTVSAGITILGSAALAQMYFDQLTSFEESMALTIHNFGSAEQKLISNSLLPTELQAAYSSVVLKGIEDVKQNELRRSEEQLTQLAKQLSHDIRSPLAALDMILPSLNGLTEDKRLVIKIAINRIRDIANTLLSAGRTSPTSGPINVKARSEEFSLAPQNLEIHYLYPIIDSLVSEKRLQYQDKPSVSIDLKHSMNSYGLFARIDPNDFKRIISNLINNAVDALTSSKGNVSIEMSESNEGLILVQIIDNGIGIPPEVLPKLGQKGATYGKREGNGLGLFFAKETTERWGGTIRIESMQSSADKSGTTISLFFPKEEAPIWFVPKIQIKADQCVVVFDDDQSIHQIWQNRFDSTPTKIRIEHISSKQAFKSYCSHNHQDLRKTLFLIDYEILGQKQTGLDLIEEFDIQEQSILVTSLYEEPLVRNRCKKLNIKLIPKPMSGFVPIEVV